MRLDCVTLKRFSWDNQYMRQPVSVKCFSVPHVQLLSAHESSINSDFRGAPLQLCTTETQGHSTIYLVLPAVDNCQTKKQKTKQMGDCNWGLKAITNGKRLILYL